MKDKIAIKENKYLMANYGKPDDFVPVKGEGSYLIGSDKKKYLDFVSGIAVNNLGYSDKGLKKAIKDQVDKFVHVSNLFHFNPSAELAELLVKNSIFSRAFFCNSGTEANEAAIKLARKYGTAKSKDKIEVISFTGGFHGRTYGSLSATGKKAIQEGFGPMLKGFKHLPFNDIEKLKKAVSKNTCAIMVEFIQGEAGIIPADAKFVAEIFKLAKKNKALVIADEVQTGLGRTGTLFLYESYKVKPDIMTLAKPLGGGLPLGSMLISKELASVLGPGSHGTTFGGNPVACAAASYLLKKISNKDFLKKVNARSAQLIEGLDKIALEFGKIKELRYKGLHIGLEITKNISAATMVTEARKKGLLLVTGGVNTIRFLPPLTVSSSEVKKALEIFKNIVAKAK